MTRVESEAPDWFVEALAAEAALDRIDVDGCSIALRQWGSCGDAPLVLVHGSAAHARWWDHIAPFLSKDHFVTAMDLSGHGASDWRDAYSWQAWAREVTAVVEHCNGGGRPPGVIAHSMGGRVAIMAAASYAGSLGGLIIVDTAVRPLREGELPATFQEGERDAPRRTYPSRQAAVQDFRLRNVPESVGLPYVLRHVAEVSLEDLPDGVVWRRDARVSRISGIRPGAESLGDVRCPIAWICAEHGNVPPELRALYPVLAGRPVPLVEIPGAYHHVMMDRPLSLVTALRAVLATWDSAGPGRTGSSKADGGSPSAVGEIGVVSV